jgi:acetyltransferase
MEAINLCGRAVCLRPLRSEDRTLLAELFGRTEPHDLQMRFFSGLRTLSPALLDLLMLSDREQRIALVASSAATGGKTEILGEARTHALTANSAELALLVRSDLKGMGLGSVMLAELISQCRSRGMSLLVAQVLQHNARMLRLARKFGFRDEGARFGITHLTLELHSLSG